MPTWLIIQLVSIAAMPAVYDMARDRGRSTRAWLYIALIVAWVARTLMPAKNPGEFDLVGFGQIPLLANGRIKPIDTVARSSLLQLQGHQKVTAPLGEKLVANPTEWLLDVAFRPEKADTYPIFAIDNVELLALFEISEDSLKIAYTKPSDKIRAIVGSMPTRRGTFSVNELRPHLGTLDQQWQLARAVEPTLRTPFQRGVVQLYTNIIHYFQLRHAFMVPGRDDFLKDLLGLQDKITALRADQAANRAIDENSSAIKELADLGQTFMDTAERTNFRVIPPAPGAADPTAWETVGTALFETFRTNRVEPTALAYAGFAQAWRNNQPGQFNKLLELFRADLTKRFGPQLAKAQAEARFNAMDPFSTSMRIYILAFLCAVKIGRASCRARV